MHLLYLSISGGGLDTNVRVLAPALARAGHRVSVLYLQPARATAAPSFDSDVRVYQAQVGTSHHYFSRVLRGATRVPMMVRALETAWMLRKSLDKIARAEPFDLVELPEGFGWARWMRAVPYLMRLHSSAWMWREMCREAGLPSDPWERFAEAEMLRGARGISSPCIFTADYIREACRVQQPIDIIPYPIDTTQFAPAPNLVEAQTILFVGRVEKRKGADVLLRAIPLVQKEFPYCRFVFAGSISNEMQALTSLRNGEGTGVRYLGVVARAELVSWYQRATISAAPSLWDNSPNTIYEAMACGTPVVATRVGGIPELVDDGVTGLLVPPGDERAVADALIALLSDAAKGKQMGLAGREKAVAKFAVEPVTQQTMDFYQWALNRK